MNPVTSRMPAAEAVVRRVIARHTGYGEEELVRESLLEEDLGIDSVLLEAVISEIEKDTAETRLSRGVDTVGDVIDIACAAGVTTGDLVEDAAQRDDEEPHGAAPGVGTGETDSLEEKSFSKISMRDFGPDGSRDLFDKTNRFAEHRRGMEERRLYWYGMASTGLLHGRGTYHDAQTGHDREYLLFSSNNYLGLAGDSRVSEAISDAARTYGATNTGCRIIGGTTALHLELERRLAEFKGREACIVFPGGYAANLGTISALAGPGDCIIADALNHMSITDGARLSGARRVSFAHNEVNSLERRLREMTSRPGGVLIAVDGVFSMHGDICPLPELVALARKYGARLLVDDAHATGVLGRTGAGTAEHFGLKDEPDLEVGTMSKALAGIGGFVTGDGDVIEYLRYYANSYVFAATIPAPVVAGLIVSLEILRAEPNRIERLWQNIHRLRSRLQGDGFDLGDSNSAILPVVVGDESMTLALGREVRKRGMFCQTVVFPGVPLGQARLRISVTAEHEPQDLDAAADIVRDAADSIGLGRRKER